MLVFALQKEVEFQGKEVSIENSPEDFPFFRIASLGDSFLQPNEFMD